MGKEGMRMGRLSPEKTEAVLSAYFEEGMDAAEIAERLEIKERTVNAVLGDKKLLEPYRQRSEAAKLRAQICVNESAEEAAKKQATLLRREGISESVTQRAAIDILDRAGIRGPKEDKKEIAVTFIHGMPKLGMPGQHEVDE